MQSSDGVTSYDIELSLESGRLRVHCGCPAGVLGKWCKHKMHLLTGDISGVLGDFVPADMDEALAWIKQSEFPRLLDEMKFAENEMLTAKKRMDNARKSLEKAAQKGVTA